jgi:D-beta-D-heptose 7-phosphate kinase/D-beta-D-heptose 1-phosphate adenosyltransferase
MGKREEKKRLIQIAKNLKGRRVLVVGDVMLDQFIYGTVERISPEAPVPVVAVEKDLYRLGGAANVAANLNALGAHAFLAGVIGKDAGAAQVSDLCQEQGIRADGLVPTQSRFTTIKTRIIAHHQQVVRFDRENSTKLSKRTVDRLIDRIDSHLNEIDAIIVSDYGKGVIEKNLLDFLRKVRRKTGMIVAVDPKVGNYKHYRNLTLMTPNHHETGQMIERKFPNTDKAVEQAGRTLRRKLGLESLVVTRGEEGMTLFFDKDQTAHIPTRARQVFDVTGAGDTVIATLTLALASGAGLYEAAEVANYAAGIAVGKLGTATTDIKELTHAITRGGQ